MGRRIAEYSETPGALLREYVWLGWEPVAVIEGGVIHFIRTDHIGRPVLATDSNGAVVWTASYDPFGTVHASTSTPPPSASPASGSRPSRACTRTGCATTIRQQGGISRLIRSGSSMGRASMGM
jgi:hypothetical protein